MQMKLIYRTLMEQLALTEISQQQTQTDAAIDALFGEFEKEITRIQEIVK
jgi:hypothetical protein